MNKQTEAMKLALEALDGLEALLLSMGLTHLIIYGDAEKAITALQEAMADIGNPISEQPAQQQEPVAWYYRFKNKSGWTAWMTAPVGSEKPVNVAFEDMECRPLVFGDTSPAAQPQQEPRKPQQRSTEHPVAYAVYHRMGGGKSLHWSEQHSEDGDHNEYQLVPLYTSPPASQSRSDVKQLPDFSPIFSGIKEK